MSDLINRQDAIDAVCMEWCNVKHQDCKHPFDTEKDDFYWCDGCETVLRTLPDLPSAEPERLADDDFETIRIHLYAFKEELCNQQRWKEANEYQRIIDRFMAFASAEPERKTGAWRHYEGMLTCPNCNAEFYDDICDFTGDDFPRFCPDCGTEMRGEKDEID